MDPTKKRIRHVKRLAEAAVPLKHHWETPGPGRGKKLPPKQRVQSGNRSQYLVNRIARDRPDILARMKAGEFAYVRQAAIAAGIITEGRQPGLPAAEASGGSAAVSSSSGPRRLRAGAWHRCRRRCAKRAMTFPQRMLYAVAVRRERSLSGWRTIPP